MMMMMISSSSSSSSNHSYTFLCCTISGVPKTFFYNCKLDRVLKTEYRVLRKITVCVFLDNISVI
jgi:hypothetical protein